MRELAPPFIAAARGRPVELHSHCTIGLAPLVYVEGVRAGFDVVHTASGALSRGTSQPEVVSTARNLQASGFAHGLDLDAQAAVTAHFDALARAKGLPAGAPREFDAVYYTHQLPGGMVTTTRRMLEELRRPELFDAVLDEVTRVRAEMGYPIIVTPVSQFIASQATRNVIDGRRWAAVSDETIRYFLGHYGEPPAPVDPAIAERVLALPQVAKLRALEPISPRRRPRAVRHADLRGGAAAPVDDARGAGRRDDRRPRQPGPGAGGPPGPGAGGDAAPGARAARVDHRDGARQRRRADRVAPWRMSCTACASPAPARSCSTSTGRSLHRGADGRAHPQPGAVEVLGRVRASGRRVALFTNASHVRSATVAAGLRADGIPIDDDEVITPVDSAITHLLRRHPGAPVQAFASDAVRAWMAEAGVPLSADGEAEIVFVAHQDVIEVPQLERAARAIERGAPLYTSSYARGYAGANGMIYSRGAMITAAIAKVTGARPRILGKPSRAAVAELSARLGVPSSRGDRRRRRPRHGHRPRQARRLPDGPRPHRDQRRDRPRPGAAGATPRRRDRRGGGAAPMAVACTRRRIHRIPSNSVAGASNRCTTCRARRRSPNLASHTRGGVQATGPHRSIMY